MSLCLEKPETVELSPLGVINSFQHTAKHDMFFYGLDLKDDRLFHVSCTAQHVIGYSSDDMVIKGLDWFVGQIHPEDLEDLDHLADDHQYLEIVPHIEYRFKHKNGNYYPLYEHRCLLYDANGHPSFLIGRIEKI